MKKCTYIYSTIQVCIILHTCFCFSQNHDFSEINSNLSEFKISKAIELLNNLNDNSLSKYDLGQKKYLLGKSYFMNDNHDLAYSETLASKMIFSDLNKQKDRAYCNINILRILSHQNIDIDVQPIINELNEYAKKSNEYIVKRTIYYNLASRYMDEEKGQLALKSFEKYIQIAKENKDTLYEAYGYMNKGSVYNDYLNNSDSALHYFKKPLSVFINYRDFNTIAYNYNNQGKAYFNLKDCNNAIKYYLKADSVKIRQNIAKSELVFYENLFKAYGCIEDYKNKSKYLELYNNLNDSLNNIEQNKAIINAENKYRASEKEKENLQLKANNLETEAKRKQTQNIAIGLGGSLVLGSIIGFLLFKNTKRKQKLAEQEKEIESQKLATVLKEQELTAIDAMIAGQEKERQRIANDLHDDLGGLMATVKLHFNALKDKNSPELFSKTNALIEEAYQKVRTVAHAKNSGVIAKQGLLKAVEQMAEKISASNKIHIEVIDHGLDNRLENSLELTLFRVIQELITNVIKHANASEATIHLTNHVDSINIMVEDNGKGFNPSQITKNNKGMGISSIDKRIEHLDGKLTIESETNKGTSIIIDIPL